MWVRSLSQEDPLEERMATPGDCFGEQGLAADCAQQTFVEWGSVSQPACCCLWKGRAAGALGHKCYHFLHEPCRRPQSQPWHSEGTMNSSRAGKRAHLYLHPKHKASWLQFSSVQWLSSVVSRSLRSHGLQHARLPCPSPTPRVYANSCPLSR